MKQFMFFVLLICNFYAFGKPIIIGVPEYSPPFVTKSGADGGLYYGFSIDLMNSICQRIHMECQYKGMNLQKLFTSLNAGDVDILLAPTPIVSTYDTNYIFSLPYLPSQAQFVALKSSNTIMKISDLKGKKVGTLKYTLYGGLLEENFQKFCDLIEFSKLTDMASALANQQIDAVVLNAKAAKFVISNSMHELKLVGAPIPIGQGYGILALQNNAPLIKEINQALLQMEEDGTYLNIYNTYFSD